MVFMLMLTVSVGVIGSIGSVAYAEDITKTLDEIKDENQSPSVIDQQGDAKKQIRGISKDIMDIVMIIITAYVVISGLITGSQFAGAGDDPQKKARLKTKLIYHILGLIFLANYFGLFSFLFENVQIF
jgi:hypothetical protein